MRIFNSISLFQSVRSLINLVRLANGMSMAVELKKCPTRITLESLEYFDIFSKVVSLRR